MVNAMLLRIHQSGHLARLDSVRKALVKEGIEVYKEIRKDLPVGMPFWPIGLSEFTDEWSVLGIRKDNRNYLAVWRRDGENNMVHIPIERLAGKDVKVSRIYPKVADESKECVEWHKNIGCLNVSFENNYMARLYLLEE